MDSIIALLRSFLAGLSGLALGLFIYNQFKLSRETFRRRNLAKYVQDILFNAGYSCMKQDLDTAFFSLIAESGNRKTTIIQTKTQPSRLDIVARLEIGEWQDSLNKITSKPESTLLFDLTIEMARFGVVWSKFEHPLKVITLSTTLPLAKFTALDLLDRVEKVHRAIILAKVFIQREFKKASLPLISDKEDSPN